MKSFTLSGIKTLTLPIFFLPILVQLLRLLDKACNTTHFQLLFTFLSVLFSDTSSYISPSESEKVVMLLDSSSYKESESSLSTSWMVILSFSFGIFFFFYKFVLSGITKYCYCPLLNPIICLHQLGYCLVFFVKDNIDSRYKNWITNFILLSYFKSFPIIVVVYKTNLRVS